MSGHHDHGGEATPAGTAFLVSVALNVSFAVAEVAYGVIAGSTALLSDAVHNLGDVVGLVLAWGAALLATRRPTTRRTYGWRKATILAALANAILILVAVGGVAWEALERLWTPAPVAAVPVIVVAALGVVVNGVSAALFFEGREHDANRRGAFVHLAADAAVSLGVVVAGVLVLVSGWMWIDPATSLVVSLVIVAGTWGLLRESADLALDAVPHHIDLASVHACLIAVPGVVGVHDLHVWPISTRDAALSVHLEIEDPGTASGILAAVGQALHDRFGLTHTTVQIESPTSTDCARGCGS